MALFDFLKGGTKQVEIYAPMKGKVLPLEQVPDEAFAQKMIGDGVAIDPAEGVVCAVADATASVFETKHAVTFSIPVSKNHLEVIVHFGVDTVDLKGNGFTTPLPIGTDVQVKKGQSMITCDLSALRPKVKSFITPVVVVNMDIVERLEILATGDVAAGDPLMRVHLK